MAFQMDLVDSPELILVTPQEEFVLSIEEEVRACFIDIAAEAEKNVCLDLSHITFIDSVAIGLIVHLYKRLCARKLKLKVVNLREQPYSLFQLLSLERLMDIQKMVF